MTDKQPLVFITGGTGHIGFRTLVEVLEAGYRVRIASRTLASAQRLATLPSIKPHAASLEYVEISDFLSPTAFNEALKDAEYVLHLASPLPDMDKPDFDLDADYLHPAMNGTTNMLNAALKHPSIKRIVITSSVGVLQRPSGGSNNDGNARFLIGPNDVADTPARSDMVGNTFMAYRGSKILALRAAEDFVATRKPAFSLVHVFPAYVQGRNEAATSLAQLTGASSNANMVRFVLGQKSTRPDPADFVHVNDVAAVHVHALTAGKNGDKFIAASNAASGSYDAIVPIVKKLFPGQVESGLLPLGGSANVMSPFSGPDGQRQGGYDMSATEQVLGVKFKGLEDMVNSLIGQAIEFVEKGDKL